MVVCYKKLRNVSLHTFEIASFLILFKIDRLMEDFRNGLCGMVISQSRRPVCWLWGGWRGRLRTEIFWRERGRPGTESRHHGLAGPLTNTTLQLEVGLLQFDHFLEHKIDFQLEWIKDFQALQMYSYCNKFPVADIFGEKVTRLKLKSKKCVDQRVWKV